MVEKPFMATAIAVAAMYGDLPRQLDLAEGFIKDVGNAMLVDGQKSLDLLQGILIIIAWYALTSRLTPVYLTLDQVSLPRIQESANFKSNAPCRCSSS